MKVSTFSSPLAASLPDSPKWLTSTCIGYRTGALNVGDVIAVEILETQSTDIPISGVEAEKRKHDELEYFEHCKKVYLGLREKYEG